MGSRLRRRIEKAGSALNNAVFFVLLLILVLSPLVFYLSKSTRNPSEFRPEEKRYVTLEAKVRDVAPEVLSRVKVGDIQKDDNGQENVRIIAVLKAEPALAGEVSLDGGPRIQVSSGQKDLYLLLRARFMMSGSRMLLNPTTCMLKAGRRLDLEFPGYWLYVEIIKVNEPLT